MASDEKMITTVGPLTKVTLELIATTSDSDAGQKCSKSPFTFYFGIGLDGLNDFEMKLYGLSVDQQMTMQFEAGQIKAFFGHLFCPITRALNIQPPFGLTIRVTSVTPATDRELVRALANKDGQVESSCDCGCSCGC